jgi:predicted permease
MGAPFGLPGVRRLFRLPRSAAQLSADVDAEIAFHLDARARELTARGLAPDAARAQALREFGDVETARRRLRDDAARHARRTTLRDRAAELAHDLRFGARTLRRSPGFTAVAALTLALGIGASTAIFGAVDGVLLKPLPYADAERVVTLWQQPRGKPDRTELASGTLVDVRERATSFAGVAAAEPSGMAIETDDGPERLRAWLVTDGFFEIPGVRAQLGRTFLPAEYVAGRDRVVVVSDGLWRRRFGGDSTLVGRRLLLRGEPYTVVGVLPAGFRLPDDGDVWAPRAITAAEREYRGSGWWPTIARLRPGVTLERARAELRGVARQLAAEHPRTNADVELSAVPLPEQLLGARRPALLLLLAASGLVLLIACANVASLTLARALARDRELGVRAALGAGRRRIVRLLGAEALVLAALGGALGVGLAWGGVRAIRALSPADLPRADAIGLDARVVAFAVAVSALTALLFGLAPALRAARGNLHERLKAGGRGTAGPARDRTRAALVVAEVALSLTLLSGAGLLVRSFVSLLTVERGFRTDHVLALTVQAWQWYRTPAARAEFVRQVVERAAALPGVRAAGATSSLPLAESIGQDVAPIAVEGEAPTTEADAPTAHVTVATPGYFEALGIARRRGRGFLSTDDARGAPVALVSEALARRHFANVDPAGRRITVTYGGEPVVREIVGVVADVRQTGLAADPGPAVFLPHAQAPTGSITFTVRTAGDPAAMAGRVKRELWAVNRAMPVASVTTLDALVDDAVRERRFHLALLGTFAGIALSLAAVGLYGVLSHAARARRREFGVRLALGARPADILRLVGREALVLVAGGGALGLLLTMGAARAVRSMLFHVSPFDPVTLGAALALVAGAAAAASLLPARRATRVDPTITIRAE